MNYITIIIIAIGLSMDACAISVSEGMKNPSLKNAIKTSFIFGLFQSIMPLFGFFFNQQLSKHFQEYTPIISFLILLFLGIHIIISSRKQECKTQEVQVNQTSLKELFLFAIATSLDALAVGFTFSSIKIDLLMAIIIIGIITYALCLLSFKFGCKMANKINNIEIVSGIILILLAFKLLLF